MNDRAKAIALLKQARDLLSERITERILELREEILEDAMGFKYNGEIDILYDHLGTRLSQVQTVLSNLPQLDDPEEPADETDGATAEADPQAEGIFVSQTEFAAPVESQSAGGFPRFLECVQQGLMPEAAGLLAELFGIEPSRAMQCAGRFRDQLHSSPDVMAKAMSLRTELESGSYNSSLWLLWECFGLQGPESISVMNNLRARLDHQG